MSQPPRHSPSEDQPGSRPRTDRVLPALDQWMSVLPDNILISEINIPGSHNAAAINTVRRTRWACQDHSITDQLQKGIRLLDIRLKPKKRPRATARGDVHQTPPAETETAFDFVTCHGHLGLRSANEFQSFETLLKECTDFLHTHPSETLILTLQVDDWRRTRNQDRPKILQALRTRLGALPCLNTPNIPTLNQCRGHIYLINRINDDPTLGLPLAIPDNTPGIALKPEEHRHYEIYVQDQYKKLSRLDPEAHKLRLTIAASEKKRPGQVLLNFASATKPIGRLVDIAKSLFTYFTQYPLPGDLPLPSLRMPHGWLLLDYTLTTDLPTFIIASNF